MPPENTDNQLTVEQLLEQYAGTDLEKFNIFFRRMRNAYPQDCLRGCVRYLGTDTAKEQVSRSMLLWLSSAIEYVNVLFDPQMLPYGPAKQAAISVRDGDPQFFTKLARFLLDPKIAKSGGLIKRVLALIPSLGDCGVLIPWLRTLADHPDEQVCLHSAKTLCALRPARGLVERQLQSTDVQTRTDALEALWRVKGPEAKGIFQLALADPDPRVAAKALVGLHLNQDSTALGKLLQMADLSSMRARLASIAAMARIADQRCIPALKMLSTNENELVSEAARAALVNLTHLASPALPDRIVPDPATPVSIKPSSEPDQENPQPARLVFETPAFRLL